MKCRKINKLWCWGAIYLYLCDHTGKYCRWMGAGAITTPAVSLEHSCYHICLVCPLLHRDVETYCSFWLRFRSASFNLHPSRSWYIHVKNTFLFVTFVKRVYKFTWSENFCTAIKIFIIRPFTTDTKYRHPISRVVSYTWIIRCY